MFMIRKENDERASGEVEGLIGEVSFSADEQRVSSADFDFTGSFSFPDESSQETTSQKPDSADVSFDMLNFSEQPPTDVFEPSFEPNTPDAEQTETLMTEEHKPTLSDDIFSFADVAPLDEEPVRPKSAPKPLPADEAAGTFEFDFAADEPQQQESPAEVPIDFGALDFGAPAQEEFSAPDERTPEPLLPVEPPQATAAFTPPPPQVEIEESGFSAYRPIIFAAAGTFLLTALLTAGYFAVKGAPGNLERMGIQNITTPGEEEAGSFTINSPKAIFVKHKEAGELFVISAEAVNNYKSPRIGVEAQVTLFNKEGQPVGTQNAFCGANIGEEDLTSMPIAEIQETLHKGPSDDPLENTPVEAGKSTKCLVVINAMPKNAVDFGIEIIHSSSEKLDDL